MLLSRLGQGARAGKRRIADLFRIPGLCRVFLVSAVLSMAWDMFTFLVPIFGTQIGLSASQIGLILGTFGSAIFTVRVILPLVAQRIGQWRMLNIAMTATGAMLLVFPFFKTLPVLMLIAFLLGIGLGGAQPMIMSLLYVLAPAGRIAEAIGLYKTLRSVTHVVIPIFFGSVGTAFGFKTVFLSNSGLLAFGGYLQSKAKAAIETARAKAS